MVEQLKDPIKQDKLVEEVTELVKKTYPDDIKNLDLTHDHIKKVLEWTLNHIHNLNQLVEENFAFLWVLPSKSNHNLSKGNFEFAMFIIYKTKYVNLIADTLERLIKMLTDENTFDKKHIKLILKDFSKNENIEFKEFMQSLRMILSGKNVKMCNLLK